MCVGRRVGTRSTMESDTARAVSSELHSGNPDCTTDRLGYGLRSSSSVYTPHHNPHAHYARRATGELHGKSSFFHDGFSSKSPRASSSGAPHPRVCPARAPQARNPGALGMALAPCQARPWPVHPLSRSPGGTAARSSERGEPHSMRGSSFQARRTRAKHARIAHAWPPIGQ